MTATLILTLHVLLATPPVSAQPSTPSRDAAVLAAVLADLTTYDGPDLPFSLVHQTPQKIHVRSAAPDAEEPPGVDLPAVTGELARRVRQAARSAKENRSSTRGVEELRGRNPGVVVDGAVDQADLQSGYPISVRPIGYSNDGSVALVRLWFPEMLHPSSGTFVMERTPRGWIVRARSFQTFV